MKKKEKKNRIKIIKKVMIVISFLILILFSITYLNKNKVKDSSGVSNNFIERFEFEKTSNYDHDLYIGEYQGIKIKIRRFNNYNLEESKKYISDKIFVIESLYRELHSPYPGVLSNTISCSDEFKPLKKENEPFEYYLIYATERLSYGTCSFDLIKYRAINYFLYCKHEKNFYHIELFIPKEENISHYENLVKSIKCLK